MLRRVVVVVGFGGAALLAAVLFGVFSSSATSTMETVRWGNVTVRIPEDSVVRVSRDALPPEANPPDGGLAVYLERPPSRLIINAENGSVLYDSVRPVDRLAFDEIAATIVVDASDEGSRGWPYAADAPPGPRETWGSLTYYRPDPASGVEVYAMSGYGLEFLRVSNGQSNLFINAEGAVLDHDTVILPQDREAFDRLLSTVRH